MQASSGIPVALVRERRPFQARYEPGGCVQVHSVSDPEEDSDRDHDEQRQHWALSSGPVGTTLWHPVAHQPSRLTILH